MGPPSGRRHVLGDPLDRGRPTGLLLALALLVCSPTVVFAVMVTVSDLSDSTEEMDGLGTAIGSALLVWTLVVVGLPALAWVLRDRPVPCAVLAVLGGLGVLTVGVLLPSWFLPAESLRIPIDSLMTLLGVAGAALGVLVAVRCSRARHPPVTPHHPGGPG